MILNTWLSYGVLALSGLRLQVGPAWTLPRDRSQIIVPLTYPYSI